MIKNVDDFKDQVDYWLAEVSSVCNLCQDDAEGLRELRRIINLIDCDVIWELNGVSSLKSEIDLNGIINILSAGGKIKKLIF